MADETEDGAAMALVEFLRARLDEDEEAARAAAAANPGAAATHWVAEQVDHRSSTGLRGKGWAVVPERVKGVVIAISPSEIRPLCVTHIARHDPARVLAEAEAKRRLLHSHYDYTGVCPRCFDWQNRPTEREPFPCEVVRLLALPYAAHPDYRDQWRSGRV